MEIKRWQEIETQVREKFPERTLGLTEWRYCFPCTSFRPPRTHHCSVCNACVMKMDHHCPWVANCVGYKNHKIFWNFLLNSFIGCTIVSICMLYTGFQTDFALFVDDYNFLATAIAATALVIMLGSLLGIHTYLLVNNLSTLEMDQLSEGNSFMNKKRKTLTTAERKSNSKSLQLMFGVKVVQNQNESGSGSS